jgi:general stress protein 26
MKKSISLFAIQCLILFSAIIPAKLYAQSSVNRDTVLIAAREIIKATTYCALITIDSTGQPQVRTMNPFPANDELITWFATSGKSRKVREIKNNPKVCVYYADHTSAKGYVNITGTAEVIDDKELLLKMKRDYWENIPDWQNIFVLIKIVPKTIEVINYKHGLNNDPETFRAPAIVL